jgi:UDP:flavonoid glycosyltransferase YjiC (YdhE family)
VVRFLDTVLPVAPPGGAEPFAQLQDFVLVVPGGGTPHPGARAAPDIIGAAAAALAARGLRTVLVGVPEAGGDSVLSCLPLLPQAQLVALMRRARLVVSNGGDTLLQALACGCACVAVPIAHDQAARIARCRELQLLRAAPLEAGAIVAAVAQLHADEAGRLQLLSKVRAAGITDAMPRILEALAAFGAQGT